MSASRIDDLQAFYILLARLRDHVGGARLLGECDGRSGWPARGVYFFLEDGETRAHSGDGPRVVRVGTHALKVGAASTLWGRLSQHRGQHGTGGGNHRGSIFRAIVGASLMADCGYRVATWNKGASAAAAVRTAERHLEQDVSRVIGAMRVLWLAIEDAPGPDSLRGFIERNSIALLSNFGKPAFDPPSETWLGRRCNRERVRTSGLWNSNHVHEPYDSSFLEVLTRLIDEAQLSGSPIARSG